MKYRTRIQYTETDKQNDLANALRRSTESATLCCRSRMTASSTLTYETRNCRLLRGRAASVERQFTGRVIQ
jgi:hypothetical protein